MDEFKYKTSQVIVCWRQKKLCARKDINEEQALPMLSTAKWCINLRHYKLLSHFHLNIISLKGISHVKSLRGMKKACNLQRYMVHIFLLCMFIMVLLQPWNAERLNTVGKAKEIMLSKWVGANKGGHAFLSWVWILFGRQWRSSKVSWLRQVLHEGLEKLVEVQR